MNKNNSPKLTMDTLFAFSKDKFVFPHQFECSVCKDDCWKLRYRSIKYYYYIVCANCFENGLYDMHLGSNDFILERGFGLDGNHRAEQHWDPETKLQLLKILEQTTDIKLIAEQMKKPRFEVWYNIVTLHTEYPLKSSFKYTTTQDILKALVGQTGNPITKLIDVLGQSAHPGLAAEAAKLGMEILMTKSIESLQQSEYWDVCCQVWQGVLLKVQILVENEEFYIELKMKELLDCLAKRISMKADILQLLKSPFQDFEEPQMKSEINSEN